MTRVQRTLRIVLRIGFAALLLTTGIAKLIDMSGFAAVVNSYALLPTALTVVAAWVLALTEVGLGLWLLSNWCGVASATVLVALHVMYLFWLVQALLRGLKLPNCGCFGVYWPRALHWTTLIEDLVLLTLAVSLYWLQRRRTA
ncbi:MAG: MauE/DoxX family redox-associated membrane protein [Gammaproteobacteria bacterium]